MHVFRAPILVIGLAALVCGCATAPAPTVPDSQIVGSSWRVFGLNAGGVPSWDITINFDENGQANGNAACNDYVIDYTLQNGKLEFGKYVMLTTNRVCDWDTDMVEERFLATLGDVSRVTIAESGSLVLMTGKLKRINARPL